MTIRRQNLVLILPVFTILATVFCCVIFFLERREVVWALKQEASASVRSVAEFLPYQWTGEGGAGQGDPIPGSASQFLNRVLFRNPSLRACFYSTNHGELFYDSSPRQAWPPPAFPGDSARQSLSQDQVWFGPPEHVAAERQRLVAFAPVKAPDGWLLCYLGVEVDASRLFSLNRALLKTYAAVYGLFFGFGLSFSLVISTLIERRIRLLSLTSRNIRAGSFDQRMPVSRVTEVRDLENAVSTMSSIFKDAVRKAKSFLFEAGLFRTERERASDINASFLDHLDCRIGNWRVIGRILCADSFGTFWSLETGAAKTWIVFGHLREGNSPVELSLEASAMKRFVARSLHGRTPKTLLREAVDLFPVAQLRIFEWDHQDLEAVFESSFVDGQWRIRQPLPGSQERFVFANLDLRNLALLDEYRRTAAPASGEDFIEEIKLLCQANGKSAILVLERCSRP